MAEDNKLPKSRTYITVDWSMDDLGPDGRTVACGMKITISNWQYERTLSPRQFETIIKQLGMTLVGAGRYIGVSERTVRRMVKGQAYIPASVVLLLRSLEAHGETPVVPKWTRDAPGTLTSD